MPIVRMVKGRLKVSHFDEMITRMTMDELIEYEDLLWDWMKTSPAKIARVLNMIHREVEWRATDT
jgi:hypothetical protein